jgi:branched-chain amino acid transport system ATP-binding protein
MPDLLEVERLTAGYGAAVVLNDVSFKIAHGQALALLGRNGMGKTTLVNSLIGVTRHFSGTIRLDKADITGMRPDQRAHAGIGWVPQERNIFRSLTVEENMTAIEQPGPWTLARAYDLFPRLAERRRNLGNELSGGEQQMLAVARALLTNPRIMLLDEPLEGLAPILVEELLAALHKIVREEGLSAIIVEQNAQKILGITDLALIIERGSIVYRGDSAALRADRALLESYMGVTGAHAVRPAPSSGKAQSTSPHSPQWQQL